MYLIARRLNRCALSSTVSAVSHGGPGINQRMIVLCSPLCAAPVRCDCLAFSSSHTFSVSSNLLQISPTLKCFFFFLFFFFDCFHWCRCMLDRMKVPKTTVNSNFVVIFLYNQAKEAVFCLDQTKMLLHLSPPQTLFSPLLFVTYVPALIYLRDPIIST